MPRLRMLIAWLVLAALPLQGFAAASMLFCGAPTPIAQRHEAHGDHAQHQHAAQHEGHQQVKNSGDAGHSCAVCAACCHLAAFTAVQALPLAAVAHGDVPPQPAARLATRAIPLPDRPPRA